jgi:pyruvate/2-oxoglutarate dehydrogenase complex dihydrolipoamide dehydrogenase (E3) component
LVTETEVVMAETERFDVVVLGGGSTGTNVAWYARDNGLSVALVERERVGGDCSYWACMPSKALLGPVHALAAARRLPGAAAAVTGVIDPAAVFTRRDGIVNHFDDSGQAGWLASIGTDLIRGHGRLAGPRLVEVTADDGTTRRLEADRAVVVATGSRPAMPPIEGLAEARPWDTRAATSASTVPGRLVVLGGGVGAAELAQAYARLGAKVTVLVRGARLLAKLPDWVGDQLAAAFADDGIELCTHTQAERVVRNTDGTVTISTTGQRAAELVADELLVVTGRTPNSDAIGVESLGIEPHGFLAVDEHLRVTAGGEWLYAVGDVNGRSLTTHQGKYQARCVADVIAGHPVTAWADKLAVPQVVFTDPEVASVGRMDGLAADGEPLHTVSVELASVSAATLAEAGPGRAELAIDRGRDVVVGATFVGTGVGELLHSATIAIVGEVPVEQLWHAVPAYPTMSEIWLRLLEADRGL